jgi:WD40 repeat protein
MVNGVACHRKTNRSSVIAGLEGDLMYERVAAGGAKTVIQLGEHRALSYDRSQRALCSRTGGIRVEDVETGELVIRFDTQNEPTMAVAFSPDGARIVSGGRDGTVGVWDLGSGEELARMTGHVGHIYSVNYSPDARRIVSGGKDGAIILWDAEMFEQVAFLRGHTSYVHSVCFSPDGTLLASGSGDGTVRVWDSLSTEQRWRQIQRDKRLRLAAEPLVERLLEEFGDPLDVVDHLRADETLSDDLRRAASRVLLKWAQALR